MEGRRRPWLAWSLVVVGRFLAPREARAQFTREWQTELWYCADKGPVSMALFATGAVADGWTRRLIKIRGQGSSGMGGFRRDVQHAVRSLARTKQFTVLAGAVLALGLAGVLVVFTLLDRIVLNPLDCRQRGHLHTG